MLIITLIEEYILAIIDKSMSILFIMACGEIRHFRQWRRRQTTTTTRVIMTMMRRWHTIISRQAIRLYSMLKAELLPELSTDLVAALAYLQSDDFSRHDFWAICIM
jgi:hypothetical protein